MSISIYDLYRIFQPGLRRRRMQVFMDRLRPTSSTRILDVGGYVPNWDGMVPITSPVVLLNLAHPPQGTIPERFTCVTGDGRAMEFPNAAFDIAFSNSVIAPVASFQDQKRFASAIPDVGRKIFS